MHFNAGEHLYDDGKPPRTRPVGEFVTDALRGGATVQRIYHVTSIPPTVAVAYHDHLMRLDVHVPCPLSDHGMHEWGDGAQRQQSDVTTDAVRRKYGA